eukprot:TRINITY_DN7786_c0_g1_i1.p1 TRINITY_DN7786_c0_g1~~TRINITY_DN7786_c0_g1_i1.p1  ORF type:complete len:709 (+),score=84.60 TRINITY_DN7786_c0_g1_i1:76-2202(+)
MSEGRVSKLQDFVAHSAKVNCVTIGRCSGRFLATGGDDRKVNIWQLGKPNAIATLSGHTSAVEAVRFDGQEEAVVAGSSSGTLKIYDLKQAKAFRTLTGHTSSIRCIDYHSYGNIIGSGSLDTTVRIWDTRRKGCLQSYKGHKDAVNVVQMSPDGHWLVSGGEDGIVKLWDMTAGKLLKEFRDHAGPIMDMEFHPSEFLLATASGDRTVKFWDMESFQCVSTSRPESSSVRTIAFDPEGAALYSGARDSMRCYAWEPEATLDAFTLGWGKVADMHVQDTEGTALVGASCHRESVCVWLVDLNKVNKDRSKAKNYTDLLSAAASERPATTSKPTHTTGAPAKPTQRYTDLDATLAILFRGLPLCRSQPSSAPRSRVDSGSANSSSSAANRRDRSTSESSARTVTAPAEEQKAVFASKPKIDPSSRPSTSSKSPPSSSSGQPRPNASSTSTATTKPGSSGTHAVPAAAAAVAQPVHIPPAVAAPRSAAQEKAISPLKRSWHKEDNLVIPSTRDKPLDLDVGEFLPTPLQQGEGHHEPSQDEVLASLRSGHGSMVTVMSTRLRNIQVLHKIWSKGEHRKALEQLVDSEDNAALVDVLGVMMSKPNMWTLDCAVAVLPAFENLINSKHESYVIAACNAAAFVHKTFGHLILDAAATAKSGRGVDVSKEERHEKCCTCYESMLVIKEALETRSDEKGKVGSALRKAFKALEKY